MNSPGQRYTVANIHLNEAFGFATVLAALDGIKKVYAVDFLSIQLVPAAFIIYFLSFRIKMYRDDSAHEFNEPVDILIAFASWLAFLVSASALGGGEGTLEAQVTLSV